MVEITPDSVAGLSVGSTFNVTVSVSGLAGKNLYGFDINFTWDTSVLQYVSHDLEVPVETYPGGVLHQPVVEVMDQLNQSAGTYWVAYASMLPAEPFNGDGVFFTVTFVLLQSSSNCPYGLQHVILADNDGNIIPLNSLQTPETLSSYVSNGATPANQTLASEEALARKLCGEEWLAWWITVTTGCPYGIISRVLRTEGS
jgi:hypothetical protein